MKVRELMTRDVVTVAAETPLRDVAALLVEHAISGVPVVDADGRPLGVVSEADIVQREAGTQRPRGGMFHWLDRETGEITAKLAARTAGEVMTAPAITIDPDRPVSSAAALMVERGVKRLPVVEDGRLVGVVSRGDLVRGFVRTDAEIERDVREDVGFGVFAIPPEELHVRVAGGEVTLGGEVETPEEARLLAEFVARVPGVVAVDSHVTVRPARAGRT